MYIGLQVLRAKIRGMHAAGTSIRHHINKAHGDKRSKSWNEKRLLGCYNREHLIAYGLLRGIPYNKIERCAERNKPNINGVFALMREHGDWKTVRELTLEKVEQLLSLDNATPSLPTSPQPTRQTAPPEVTRRPLEKRLGP